MLYARCSRRLNITWMANGLPLADADPMHQVFHGLQWDPGDHEFPGVPHSTVTKCIIPVHLLSALIYSWDLVVNYITGSVKYIETAEWSLRLLFFFENYNCCNGALTVALCRGKGCHMHGLIYKTNIWLLKWLIMFACARTRGYTFTRTRTCTCITCTRVRKHTMRAHASAHAWKHGYAYLHAYAR